MAEPTWHIEPLAHEHLDGVARVHVQCFPGYFLTNLGVRFLRFFYRDFVDSDLALGYVAVDGASGEAIGLVAGAVDPAAFRRWSFQQRPFRKMLIAVGRLFCSARLWGQAARRVFGAIGRRLRAPLGKGKRKASSGPADRHASLLSIAVAPEMRGSGVAMKLIRCFERSVVEKGLSRVSLTVLADNERAIRFYEKAGWVVLKRNSRTVRLFRELRVNG